jgi:hypothetical protein
VATGQDGSFVLLTIPYVPVFTLDGAVDLSAVSFETASSHRRWANDV